MRKAVIFDMDGVVSDTQHLHARVESLILGSLGISMDTQEITRKYAGVSDREMFEEIFKKYRIKVDMDEIIFKKWDLMKKAVKNRVVAMPYALEFINELKKDGFKLAVASASTKDFINYVLRSLNLMGIFDVLVSAQEVIRGKPAPDIFILTATRLKVSPRNCVVIEDGRSGMIAAKKAGMKCIALLENKKEASPADLSVTSLKEISPLMVKNLLKVN